MIAKYLFIILIAIFFSGCVSVKAPSKNPAHLTVPCELPVMKVNNPTYRDAIILAVKRGAAIKKCRARMKALREL